jgi:hypothetical protein
MLTKNPVPAACVIVAAALLAGCGAASAHSGPPPAVVKAVPGSVVKELHLTSQAIHRLGITTETVRVAKVSLDGHSGPHKVIPYSAVVYDNDGSTWTYVATAPRTFLRQRIAVGEISGETAILVSGPAQGAAVVTVGAPELLGTEYDISGEE